MAQLALDETLQIDGDGVWKHYLEVGLGLELRMATWPGQFAVLLPPSFDHQRHIESQQESDGNSSALIPTPSGKKTIISSSLLNTATV